MATTYTGEVPSAGGPDDRQSGARYRALFDCAPGAIVLTGDDARFVDANPAACALLGYPRDELLTLSFHDVTPAESADEARALWSRFLSDGRLSAAYAVVRKDGARVHVAADSFANILPGLHCTHLRDLTERDFTPLRTPTGEIDGLMGVSFETTELQHSTVALGHNEEQLRTVLENISDVISVMAPDATILYESPSVKRMLGFEPEELVGHNAFEFIHPDDRPAVVRAIDRSRLEVAVQQFRFRHKNGEWRTLEGIGRIHTSENGSPTAVVVSRDVTDRQRATAESRLLQFVTLRVAEAKDQDTALHAVMQLVCESMEWAYAEAWLPSVDGRYLEPSRIRFSTGAEPERFRRSADGLRFEPGAGLPGRAWSVRQPLWIADLDDDLAFSRRTEAERAGFRSAIALPVVVEDGAAAVIAVLVFYAVQRQQEDPRFASLLIAVATQLGTAMQRKQAELALSSSQKLLQSVVTSAPVVVFALDRNGLFTLSEGRGLQALGLRPGQVVGLSALDVYSDAPEVAGHLRRALAGETFIGTADVAGRSYQTWYSPIVDAEGAVAGVVGVATDITEQRQLEEQLRQAQKLESVGRLAGGIAHDFNNILTAISGYAELIMEHLPATEPLHDEVMEIRRASEKASLLTYQLLAFSRKQILRPKTLNLNEVVTDVSRMLQRLIGEDITIVARLRPDLHAVSADPGQLTQVLINLSMNARDAMPAGGVLTIETANVDLDAEYASARHGIQPGSFVMLAVSDTGTGMPPEVQARIFEPFFTTKPVGKGTGMGLATVYGVVKQSGGHVWAYSEVGHGSTFKVYLPRVTQTEAAPEPPAAETALARGVETILLVEDEETVRRLVCRALEACGYQMLEAPDGAVALDICSRTEAKIDMIITDVVMPQMSGRELVARLGPLRPDLRVLFMSGYTDTAIAQLGVLDEASHFLQKPFTMRMLTDKVREILDA